MRCLCQFSVVVAFLLSYIVGCGTSSVPSTTATAQPDKAVILEQYNRHVHGEPSISLQQLTDSNLSLQTWMCQQSGYYIDQYAGQSVALLKYNLEEKYYSPVVSGAAGEALYLWLLARGEAIICAYITVRENSLLTPGNFAVTSPNVKAPTATLTQGATGSTVSLETGQIFTLTLPGNDSTGYTWEVTSGAESILVKRGDTEWIPDSTAVGSDGVYTFTFEATAPGTAPFKLIYHRPSEAGTPPLQVFEATVDVKVPLCGTYDPAAPGYSIFYNTGVDTQAETARLSAKYGFEPTHVFDALGGFSANFSTTVLEQIRYETTIKGIYYDKIASAS